MTDIDFSWHIRTPFPVEAIMITEHNLEAVAKLVGEVQERRGEKSIALDRRIVPNVGRAYPGWYLTRLGDNLRCYSPKIFHKQFIEMPDVQPVPFRFSYGDDQDSTVELDEPQGDMVAPLTLDPELEIDETTDGREFVRSSELLID